MKGCTQKSEIRIGLGFSAESLLAHEEWNIGAGESGYRLRWRRRCTSLCSTRTREVAVVKKKGGAHRRGIYMWKQTSWDLPVN